jgi:hypothetical protein
LSACETATAKPLAIESIIDRRGAAGAAFCGSRTLALGSSKNHCDSTAAGTLVFLGGACAAVVKWLKSRSISNCEGEKLENWNKKEMCNYAKCATLLDVKTNP